MLWPVILPFQLTLGLMICVVLISTLVALAFRWKAGWVFVGSLSLAFVAFVPACNGIMARLDASRFGLFTYAQYADVQDERVERYLPPGAHTITVEKTGLGHRAQYTISDADLKAFIDRLWNDYGKNSVVPRAEDEESAEARPDEIQHIFGDLGWPPLNHPIHLRSPTAANGAGANYFYEPTTGTVYHRGGYW